MTGFDETVPPDLDPDADATSAEDATDNVVPPSGGPVPDHSDHSDHRDHRDHSDHGDHGDHAVRTRDDQQTD